MTTEQASIYLTKLGIVNIDLLKTTEKDTAVDKKKEDLKESVEVDVGFSTFKSRLKKRYKDKPFSTNKWKELNSVNIGGHVLRLIEAPYVNMIFDGLNMIETFDSSISLKIVRDAYNELKKKIKLDFEKYRTEKLPEDDIIDDVSKELKKELDKRLKIMFKLIGNTKTNSESFLDIDIMSKIGKVFTGFGFKISSKVNSVIDNLGVSVIDDKEDVGVIGSVDSAVKRKLMQKNRLLKQSLLGQIKQTTDKMAADVKTKLASDIVAGKKLSQIKAETEEQFNYKDGIGWKFNRIVNTGLRQNAGLLRLKKYQTMGFYDFAWATMEDDKVREDHARRNNKIYSIQKALDGRDIYPGGSTNFKEHPNYNCRCRALPY